MAWYIMRCLIVCGCTLVVLRRYICYLGTALDLLLTFVVFGHMLLYTVVFGRTWCDFCIMCYYVVMF